MRPGCSSKLHANGGLLGEVIRLIEGELQRVEPGPDCISQAGAHPRMGVVGAGEDILGIVRRLEGPLGACEPGSDQFGLTGVHPCTRDEFIYAYGESLGAVWRLEGPLGASEPGPAVGMAGVHPCIDNLPGRRVDLTIQKERFEFWRAF